jgi:L-fucose isomerase-like protein
MKMTNTTIITALPIGEIDTDVIRSEFESIIGVFNDLGTDLFVIDPVSDEESARESVQELSKKNPDLLLIIPLRGLSAQAIEIAILTSRTPCLICPIQGRFALPSSVLGIGALRESKIPIELVYAPSHNPDFIERLQCVTRAAKAFSRIRQSRIGVIGGLFANLVSCRYDPQIINSRLGITLVPISFKKTHDSILSISQRMSDVEQLRQEITTSYTINAADLNQLDAGIQLHLALKQMAAEQKIDAFATECWSGFPKELGLNPCLGFIEDAYTLACEGDVMLCISLLLVRYLTGIGAYVGDLYDLDLDGILTLIHCGAPASLTPDKGEVVLSKSKLALERGFETLTCRPQLMNGSVTLFRFFGKECDKLHLAFGELLGSELSPDLTVKVKLKGNRWEFLEQCFGNHYIVVAGDIRRELKLLGKWLRITIFET